MRRHRMKLAINEPREEASEETNLVDTFIADFQPPG